MYTRPMPLVDPRDIKQLEDLRDMRAANPYPIIKNYTKGKKG